MEKQRPLLLIVFASIAVFLLAPGAMAAMDLDDGTYSIDYTVLQADNDSVSIANDYFQKPAILTIEDGNQHIEFTVNHSEWIKELKAAADESFVDVTVVNEDTENDLRTVTFQEDADLSQPIYMQMHIHIASMEPVYDHQYTVRFSFDTTGMELVDSPPAKSSVAVSKGNSFEFNQTLVYGLIVLLIVVAIILVRIFRSSHKKTK